MVKGVQMNNIAFYNGEKMTVEQASIRHDIFVKLKLKLPLTERERATYLLLVATDEQSKEFLIKEKQK